MTSSTGEALDGSDGFFATLFRPLPPRTPLGRQLDIDAARGIAILLVVIGHVVSTHGEMPKDNDWYGVLRQLIYTFHMPLFMFLTGTSFALSLPYFGSYPKIFEYSRSKVARLLVPYTSVGLIVVFGKLAAANYMSVDNLPKGSLDGIVALIVNPGASAAGFLWFIYVLGLYFMILPAFLHATMRRPIILFVVSIAALSVGWPNEFMLRAAFANLPFFSAGMLLWLYREQWLRISVTKALISMFIFTVAIFLAEPFHLSKWIVGALSIPAIVSIAQYVPTRIQAGLSRLGQLSLSIYLMSSIIIGIEKGLMSKILVWDGRHFLIFFPVLVISGVMIPVLIKQLTRQHFPAIDRFI